MHTKPSIVFVIGLAGVAAAVATALHHATGVRGRELPITIETLVA